MNNFAFHAHAASQRTLKKLEESKKLVTKGAAGSNIYSAALFESKTLSDAKFLLSLGQGLLEESKQDVLLESIQNVYEKADELLQEVNMKPRMVSPALNPIGDELNESTSHRIYSDYLTCKINKDFTKPLFEGTLLETNKEESKFLMNQLVMLEESENVDPELFLKYAIFENSLSDSLMDIVLSNETRSKIDTFLSIQENSYFKIFDRNAKVVLEELQESVKELASLIAPSIFEESLKAETKVDVSAFAGISKAFTK